MEELIEEYLFQTKCCPLPGIGVLKIQNSNASTQHRDNRMTAPIPHINFSRGNIPADRFIEFIAVARKVDTAGAGKLLEEYCSRLQNISSYAEIILDHAGKFYLDADAVLSFKQESFAKEFLPSLQVQPVTHADSSHVLQVGDKETTSGAMTEYYKDAAVIRKEKWWIAAIILFAIAALAIVMYLNNGMRSSNFGNAQPVIAPPEPKTYTTDK